MNRMATRDVSMVCRRFVVSSLVMLGGFFVVTRRMREVFWSFLVMSRSLLWHEIFSAAEWFPQTWSINSTQEVVAAFLWKVAALGQSANSLVKQPTHAEAAHVAERHRTDGSGIVVSHKQIGKYLAGRALGPYDRRGFWHGPGRQFGPGVDVLGKYWLFGLLP
jgi:hypothetical protein